MSAVKALPRVTPTLRFTFTTKAVLRDIADHVNDYGEGCWVGVMTIAKSLLLSRKTVQRALTKLQDAGYVQIQERPGTTNLYKLCITLLGIPEGSVTVSRGVRHRDAPRGVRVTRGVRHRDAQSIKDPPSDPSMNLTRAGLKPVSETVEKIRKGLEAEATQ